MSSYSLGSLLLACSLTSCTLRPDWVVGDREFGSVLRHGATASVILRIVDSEGAVVPNAHVQVSFMMESSKWIKGLSDEYGHFQAKGKSRGEMRYSIEKKGYYISSCAVKG